MSLAEFAPASRAVRPTILSNQRFRFAPLSSALRCMCTISPLITLAVLYSRYFVASDLNYRDRGILTDMRTKASDISKQLVWSCVSD